ncbi:MAG: hypothetical protein AAF206_11215 [Bacteroidota bacterium]
MSGGIEIDGPLGILIGGFFYRGNLLDIGINYLLLFLCLLPFFHAKGRQKELLGREWLWISLLFLVLQIWIWFSEHETGISLIWSALAGVNLILIWRNWKEAEFAPRIRNLLIMSLIAVLLGDLYYAITLPPITTIAHGIASVVGMGVYGVMRLVGRD